MKTKTAVLLCLLVMVAVSVYAAAVYPSLPDRIPTHWDIRGHVNGYGPRGAVFIGSALSLFSLVLLVVLPWLSPKKWSVDSFRSTFNYICFLLSLMMGYMGAVMISAAKYPQWDSMKPLLGGIMLFTGLLGNMMGKVQRNFFVGIRTPWTLASEKVWTATHRLAARLMTAVGVGGAIAIFVGVAPIPVFVVLTAALFYPVLYSLLLYKKLERTQSI